MAIVIPTSQWAVELTGPDELRLRHDKPVAQPGPHQVLVRVDVVGICFSDLKLLKQFDRHARKSVVLSGVEPGVLEEIPSYVPDGAPTVPGHEVVGSIVAAGEAVQRHAVGDRVMVQADYRWLKTAGSNAAFGYNFEGGMQEYVLLDERVIMDPELDVSCLIAVDKTLGDSAVALVEPWACVECSYITEERRGPLAGGRLLVVAEAGATVAGLDACFRADARPGAITIVAEEPAQREAILRQGLGGDAAENVEALAGRTFDDIIYFGTRPEVIEALGGLLATGGIINLVLGGGRIEGMVSLDVGRIHYQGTRWIGTTGSDAADGYEMIPPSGEVREGDAVLVMGAGGPMGQMHVIRLACGGKAGVSVTGTDLDQARLGSLLEKVRPLARATGIPVKLDRPEAIDAAARFSYVAIMVPVGALVAEAIAKSRPGALINIFAGIGVGVMHAIDLDRVVRERCFMFGTSGSRLGDMMVCLEKAQAGQLETNASVDAVSGLAGAIEGIRAVENRTMAGKIVVYPALRSMGLMTLAELAAKYPTVAAQMREGMWTRAAEDELLRVAREAYA